MENSIVSTKFKFLMSAFSNACKYRNCVVVVTLLKYFYYLPPEGPAADFAASEFPPPNLGPSSQQWESAGNSTTLQQTFYKDIPEEVMDGIRRVYAIDFEMFGYDKYKL